MTNELLTTIAECPGCRAALGLPSDADPSAELECPACDARFTLVSAIVREVRMARLAPPAPVVDAPPEINLELTPPLPIEQPSELSPHVEAELPLAAEAAKLVAQAVPAEKLPQLAETDFVDLEATTIGVSPADAAQLRDDSVVDEFADAHEAASDDFDLEPALARSPAHAEYAEDSADAIDEADDYDEAADDYEEAADDFAAPGHQFDLRSAHRPRRRKPSAVRTLVGIVGGGVLGLLLAGYALLWFRGPSGDLFQMGPWLPQAMLPPSMRDYVAGGVPSRDPDNLAISDGELLAEAATGSSAGDAANDATADVVDGDANTDADADVAATQGIQVDPSVTPASNSDPVAVETPPLEAPAPEATVSDHAPSPTPKPNWPSTPLIADLIEPRLYSLEELAEVAAAADDAGRRFLSGDLARPESVREMGQAYVQLCAAAERLTLTDPAAYGSAMFTQQALAKQPINLAAGSAARRNDLGVIAARWLQHSKRQNEGTFFVGRVRDMRAQGAWTEYRMEIAYAGQTVEVPVLMDKLRFSTGADAAIAGVIVKDPQRRIAGYVGEAPQVVVAGYAFDPARYADADDSTALEFTLPDN